MKKLIYFAAISQVLLGTNFAIASHETDLAKATGVSCEALLHDATNQFGSLVEIEYAISFNAEARWANYESRDTGREEERRAELAELNRTASKLAAMHRLFQERSCPIAKDWHSYQPKTLKMNESLWN